MKTLNTLVFAGLFAAAIGASAQSTMQPPPNSPVPQQQTNYIKQHVSDVTTDQESKILTIEQSCSMAMQRATNKKTKDSISRSSDSQLKAVLTPGQYTQYKKIKKNLPKENRGSY